MSEERMSQAKTQIKAIKEMLQSLTGEYNRLCENFNIDSLETIEPSAQALAEYAENLELNTASLLRIIQEK